MYYVFFSSKIYKYRIYNINFKNFNITFQYTMQLLNHLYLLSVNNVISVFIPVEIVSYLSWI